MMVSTHGKHSKEIYSKADCANEQKLVRIHLGRVETDTGISKRSLMDICVQECSHALDSFKDDENGDED